MVATINEKTTATARHCGYCGLAVGNDVPAIERFGERFCSEAHAEEFAAGVRSARMQAAARVETPSMSCAPLSPAPRGWKDSETRGLLGCSSASASRDPVVLERQRRGSDGRIDLERAGIPRLSAGDVLHDARNGEHEPGRTVAGEG